MHFLQRVARRELRALHFIQIFFFNKRSSASGNFPIIIHLEFDNKNSMNLKLFFEKLPRIEESITEKAIFRHRSVGQKGAPAKTIRTNPIATEIMD